MFFHFWVVDHSLRTEHGAFYDSFGRWLIASAVLAGWALGIAGVTSDFVLPTLMGFLGGGVVVNSIKKELPEKGEGRALPFVLGALGYALLLLLVGAMETSHVA
jgi:zinc transporter ZupT